MRYPKEIYSETREQTFCVIDALVKSKGTDGSEPLKIYDSIFSRFDLTIINKEKRFATYFISIDEFPNIREMSKIAYAEEIHRRLYGKGEGEATSSPAYTTKFKMGNYAGKPPAEIILTEGPEGVQRQMNFLENSVRQNPRYERNNRPVINACQDALNLYAAGKLVKDTVTSHLVLFSMPFAFANVHKRRPDGTCRTRQMDIRWNFGEAEPVQITIMNCWAPTTKRADSPLETPVLGQAKDKVVNVFRMTASKWMKCIDAMETDKRLFENKVWPELRKMAENEDWHNRQQTKTSPQSQPTYAQPQTAYPQQTYSQPYVVPQQTDPYSYY